MRTSLALLLCAFALAVPAAANAAAPVGTSPDGFFTDVLSCPFDCTMQQDLLANQQMRVPGLPGTANGVITRWRILGAGGQVRLRRLDGSSKAGLGATQFETLDASGTPRDFGASLPVRTGDALALDVSGGTEIAAVEDTLGLGGDEVNLWIPPVQDGVAPGGAGGFAGYIAYQAFVEPDVDADGLGDETQDPSVPQPGGGGNPPAGGDTGGGDDEPKPDPYAAIRRSGPKVKIAGKATAKKGVVSVSATNPYAFAIKGTLVLRNGRKKVGKAALKLGASGARTVRVRVGRAARKRKLTAVATMKGPVGKARVTKRKITVAKAAKPKPGTGGFDGTYKGDGLRAGWAMGIEDGVVKSFSGRINTYCTESGRQKNVSFGMFGDDPDPRVGADGSFAWEATKGYGFVKLRFDGKVNKNGTVTASMMVEDRSPLHGSDRFEFDYCFAGEKNFTLKRK